MTTMRQRRLMRRQATIISGLQERSRAPSPPVFLCVLMTMAALGVLPQPNSVVVVSSFHIIPTTISHPLLSQRQLQRHCVVGSDARSFTTSTTKTTGTCLRASTRVTASVKTKPTGSGGMGKGKGMGGSTSNKSKPKGMRSAKASKNVKAPSFDVSASLQRLEKLYDQLMRQDNKRMAESEDEYGLDDVITTEYIVAAREMTQKLLCDWVPIANLCLARTRADAQVSEGATDPAVRAALSLYCREISHVAGQGSRLFTSIPRQNLQYAVEPIDSFYKHVFDAMALDKRKDRTASSSGELDADSTTMTKQQARVVLHLPDDCYDPREIKNMYRKRAFACHPDRVSDRPEDERQKAVQEYGRIQLAYETLSSGIKNGSTQSWYASLGGRARTDFVGPIDLLPIATAETVLANIQSGLIGLDPNVVQTFVTRSQSSST